MKGKWFDIWKLRDHNKPYIGGELDTIAHIKIFDVFGYFQKPFADVVDDMVKRKMATEYEQKLITEMKARRGKFAEDTIEKITEYCLAECRLLSKQMSQLRELMFKLGLKPKSWHGPGALANAAFRKYKVAKHFGEHIAAFDISEQQDWAHHAFIGGRIESLKQGYLKSTAALATTGLATALYIYDVSSCYPAGAVELPSLAPEHGRWIKHDAAGLGFKSLAELKLRGARVKNYKLNKDGEPWLVANVLPIWRTMTELPERGDGSGLVTRDYKQLITIGSALSFRRWKLAGRWSPEPGEAMAHQRSINAHELGIKRMLNIHKLNELLNCERPANVAKRAYELVPTIPTINRDPALSRPRPPEWIDEETGERIEGEGDMADAMAGARS